MRTTWCLRSRGQERRSGQLDLEPGQPSRTRPGDVAAREGVVDPHRAVEQAGEAVLQALDPLLRAGAVGVAHADPGALFAGVGADRRALSGHGVAVHAEHRPCAARQRGETLVVGRVVPVEQPSGLRLRQRPTVDGHVVASVGLDRAVGPAVVSRSVQVHDRPGDVGGDEGLDLGLQGVDLGRAAVAVGCDLLRGQHAQRGDLSRNPQTRMGHRDDEG